MSGGGGRTGMSREEDVQTAHQEGCLAGALDDGFFPVDPCPVIGG